MLAQFRLEQTGDQIQIRDSDGSVYVGQLQSAVVSNGQTRRSDSRVAGEAGAATFSEASGARPASSIESVGGISEASPTLAVPAGLPFSVRGTNRTLNQLVVFNLSVALY